MILVLIQTVDRPGKRRVEVVRTNTVNISIHCLNKMTLIRLRGVLQRRNIILNNEKIIGKQNAGNTHDKHRLEVLKARLCRRHI